MLSWTALSAQEQIPRDTSYTLESTVAKVRKQYPELDVKAVSSSAPKTVTSTYSIQYKDLGYRALVANLFQPHDTKNAVAVLMIHGGGWRSGAPGLMTPMAERLAEAGYFVMAPEYRLSLEAPYPAAVDDLKDALSWMISNQKDLGIDPDRIVVIGCSAGGQLAALIGTTTNVIGIIDVDGVLAFKHPDSQEGTVAAQWLGGTYEEVPEIWEEASALSHVSDTTPPTLFLASKYPRFLAGHEEFMEVLKKSGTYTECKKLDDAPHSFWLLHPWFEPTMSYIIQFLDEIKTNGE